MLVKHTLFKTRPVVGGRQLWPLTAGRVVILEEMGNPLGTGSGEETSSLHIFEAFLVATLDAEELEEASACETEWRRRVRLFSLEVPDEDLNAFWQVLQAELEDAAAKMTEGKPRAAGKRGGTRRAK